MKLDVKEYADKSILCWLATSNIKGEPNVSPKEIFLAVNPNIIIIANIASPCSEKNIRENPSVCVSYVDIFEQRGCKLKGEARVIEPADSEWDNYIVSLRKIAGDSFPIRNIFEVTVSKASNILAPSYQINPQIQINKQIASAMNAYGVKPA
ncbi:pyridoxamine 5'-phosphate oxidase family protein [Hahella sp. CR1]|uniref:pyridoxamine 5'-phosphate oxidase family protein n=1 Tax=Hahella sp. CR1 TaxID=2992807 RepID=UPI00244187DE|nr:pyridoxamine 5'-phosphate oxidase family protein [Hahella sp. CR1]MDG9668717.1 pyridoxamine 5'-phosphate oxidase family protein [Hahella sp. CR1]